LFPTWPVFNPKLAARLFVSTMAVLVAPRVFGYVLLCTNRQMARRYGAAVSVPTQGKPVLWRVLVGRTGSESEAQSLARRIRREDGDVKRTSIVRLDSP